MKGCVKVLLSQVTQAQAVSDDHLAWPKQEFAWAQVAQAQAVSDDSSVIAVTAQIKEFVWEYLRSSLGGSY